MFSLNFRVLPFDALDCIQHTIIFELDLYDCQYQFIPH